MSTVFRGVLQFSPFRLLTFDCNTGGVQNIGKKEKEKKEKEKDKDKDKDKGKKPPVIRGLRGFA